jgi:hypothetical protein
LFRRKGSENELYWFPIPKLLRNGEGKSIVNRISWQDIWEAVIEGIADSFLASN